MRPFAIGVDVGATSIKFAAVSDRGEFLSETREPTEGEKGKSVVIQNLLKGISTVMDGLDRSALKENPLSFKIFSKAFQP